MAQKKKVSPSQGYLAYKKGYEHLGCGGRRCALPPVCLSLSLFLSLPHTHTLIVRGTAVADVLEHRSASRALSLARALSLSLSPPHTHTHTLSLSRSLLLSLYHSLSLSFSRPLLSCGQCTTWRDWAPFGRGASRNRSTSERERKRGRDRERERGREREKGIQGER